MQWVLCARVNACEPCERMSDCMCACVFPHVSRCTAACMDVWMCRHPCVNIIYMHIQIQCVWLLMLTDARADCEVASSYLFPAVGVLDWICLFCHAISCSHWLCQNPTCARKTKEDTNSGKIGSKQRRHSSVKSSASSSNWVLHVHLMIIKKLWQSPGRWKDCIQSGPHS